MSHYISFDNFTSEEYLEFIRDCPKLMLVAPLLKIPKYKKLPLIRSFRPESIKEEVAIGFYEKEEEKKQTLLKQTIVKILDELSIKKAINDEHYAILSKKQEADKEAYKEALFALCHSELNTIKIKYMAKLFDLDEDLAKEIDQLNLKQQKKELEHKRNKEYNSLIEKHNQLLALVDHQKEEIQKLKEEMSKESVHFNLQDLLLQLDQKLMGYSNDELAEAFKNLNLTTFTLNQLYQKMRSLKKKASNDQDISCYMKLTYIELMILNMMEEINNG